MSEIRVKSGNLFDIGTSTTDYTSPSYTNLTISNDTLSMKLSSESGMTYAIRTQRQTQKGTVTFAFDTDCNTGIGIIVRIRDNDDTRWLTSSDTSISGFTYNNVYSGWYKWTPLNSGHPIQAITIPNVGSYYYVGFLFAHSSSAVGNVYSATNIRLLEGTYTSETIPPYQPYFLNLPSHQKTADGWKDIPTHTMTANGWQGELTSQSPLEFRATGQSLLDWRIDGASGGVGDWDETEQQYKIPVNVRGENLFDGNLKVGYIADASFNLDDAPNYRTLLMYLPAGTYILSASSAVAKVRELVNNGYDATISTIESLQFTINAYSRCGFSFRNASGSSYRWDDTITIEIRAINETNLYTDAQLMDGDSLDYTTDQTSIPITQGDNTLTVGTAVQPSKVFVKFEG